MVRFRELPDQDYLSEVFDYNPKTGILVWKIRPRDHFKSLLKRDVWNKVHAGTDAGNVSNYGLRCSFDSETWENHYIIWKLAYGKEPKAILHRNKIHCDNALSNLYEEKKANKTDYIRYKPGTQIEVVESIREDVLCFCVQAGEFKFAYRSDLHQAMQTALYLRERYGV